jgi:Undecaprenyl-phosphate glucose phosphotransferase
VLKQRHQLFVLLLGVGDATVAGLAALIAWAVRRAQVGEALLPIAWSPEWLRQAMLDGLLVLVVPLCVVCMRAFGLYQPWRDKHVLAECRQIAKACFATLIALIVLIWALGPQVAGTLSQKSASQVWGVLLNAGQVQLIALAVVLPACLIVERAVFRLGLRMVRTRGRNLRHVAVLGTGRLGRIVCRTLDRNGWTGIHVAYFLHHHDHEGATELLGRPIRGGLAQLEVILEQEPVDAVYLAVPNTRASLMPDVLRRLERFPCEVRIIPDVSPRHSPLAMNVYELDGMPILSVRESPMVGLAGAIKRLTDVFGALLAVVVFGVPMVAIVLAIRATSPGPAIFRQRRVGLGGEEFNILKFRTMRHADDESQIPAMWTERDDPRITSIGRLLRRTSLDELPQLFNVLAGDMSLVGPRPERPELIARFRDDWRGYVLRQHVKAGMTGWAQVNGLRGDTSLRKRLQHDLFYIRHWSLAFDLKILVLTIFRGFIHRNAH